MRRYIIFFSIIAGTVAGVLFVRAGYYPVALVGGDFLFARDFWNQYRAMRTYYEKSSAMYGVSSTMPVADMERAVLEGMIEESLVRAGVRHEVGAEVDHLVSARVDSFLSDSDLVRAADVAYGVNAQEFRAMVLVPQAEREILTGKLFLRGEKLQDWLEEAKRHERVIMLAPGFRWNGSGLEAKQ
ncbi:MAG: hypothetical protein HYY10_02840 [Candidatus Liptonbacteria bacterium]|nr:hypothetical protein [Candidatus Liptonbacteria bacterium]